MSEDLTKKFLQSADEKLTLILTVVQSLTVRVDNIDSRLLRVEQTGQNLITDIARLQEGQRRLEEGYGRLEKGYGRLEEGQESLRSELRALRRSVDYRFMRLSGTVLAYYRDLDERVTRLELNINPPNTQT